MGEVNLKTVRKIELALWCALILLIILGVLTDGMTFRIVFDLLLADMIGLAAVALIFRRCPHCGKILRVYGKFCPQCGKELDW